MSKKTTIAMAALAVMLSGPVLAAGAATGAAAGGSAGGMTASTVKDAANGSNVSLTGTVEDFNSEKSFNLRDNTGSVKVDLSSAKSVVLKNGDQVTVNGRVDKGITGTTVAATNVSENKHLGEQVGEAINSITGADEANAQAVNVGSLPDKGLVKVNGTVDDVSSEKKFTLRDSTGKVDVALKTDQSAALHKGTNVTVIGYVNNGMMSKSIDATKVDVRR